MAYRIKIGNYHFTDFISLTGGKLRIVNWAWEPAYAVWKQEYTPSLYGPAATNMGYEQPVTDVFTLAYFGCDEEIRETLVRLRNMISKIQQYHGETEFPYWLWVSTEGELGRRALLYNAVWKPVTKPGLWPMLGTGKILGQLSLTRHPLWEDSAEFTTINAIAAGLSTCGGIARFTDMPGTAPGRIQRAEWNALPVAGATTNTLTDVWVGFRREDDGTTDFVPVWECENGTNVTDAADEAEGAMPPDSADNHVVIDFSTTETLAERFHINVNQVIGGGTEYGHFAGTYIVLLRARVSDEAFPAEVQMRSGYRKLASPYTEGMDIGDSVAIDCDDYKLYELGEVRIPATQLWYDPTGENFYEKQVYYSTISIWASGSNNSGGDDKPLYCDCLILIPTDFFCRIRDASIYTDTGGPTYHKSIVVTEPDERAFGVNSHTNNYLRGVCTPETKRWYLPEGNSMMVVAAQAATVQDLNDLIWGEISFASRWEDYRIPGTLTVA